jgi:UDP-glucose 4-epimerase
MKVLVTGGAGFIGSHLCEMLLRDGHDVVAYDDLSTGSRENVAHLSGNPHFTLCEGDVLNELLVDDAVAACDAVVHFAARLGLKIIMESPLATMAVNARGAENVLHAATARLLPTIVASTSEVYGAATKIPSAESDPICFGSPTVGRWAYACAKAYDEFYALALHGERRLPVAVTRFFNTVGTRQTGRYGMVLPRFVAQALAGEPLTVYGDGTQTRCFCAVNDVVWGVLTMLYRIDEVAGEVFNLGNPTEIRILDLAKRVIELTESTSRITFVPFSEAYPAGFAEIMRRVPDVTKARESLGFEPKTSLDTVIRQITESLRRKEVAA